MHSLRPGLAVNGCRFVLGMEARIRGLESSRPTASLVRLKSAIWSAVGPHVQYTSAGLASLQHGEKLRLLACAPPTHPSHQTRCTHIYLAPLISTTLRNHASSPRGVSLSTELQSEMPETYLYIVRLGGPCHPRRVLQVCAHDANPVRILKYGYSWHLQQGSPRVWRHWSKPFADKARKPWHKPHLLQTETARQSTRV